MAASLDDIFTTQRNGVIALNNIQQTLAEIGANTTATTAAPALVFVGKGRLLRVSVIVPGTTTGLIHNCNSLDIATQANALYAIPNVMGVYSCGLVFNSGIVVVPGTGQVLNITYLTRT